MDNNHSQLIPAHVLAAVGFKTKWSSATTQKNEARPAKP
jgi:hypothetical protein